MATLLENLSIEKYFKQSPPEFTAWSQNKLVDYLHQLVDDPDSVQYADAFFDVVDPNTDSDWIFYNTSLDKTNFMLLRQAAEKHDSLQAALCALYQLSCKEQNIEKFKTVNHINNTGQVWHEMAQNNSAKNNWVRQAINNKNDHVIRTLAYAYTDKYDGVNKNDKVPPVDDNIVIRAGACHQKPTQTSQFFRRVFDKKAHQDSYINASCIFYALAKCGINKSFTSVTDSWTVDELEQIFDKTKLGTGYIVDYAEIRKLSENITDFSLDLIGLIGSLVHPKYTVCLIKDAVKAKSPGSVCKLLDNYQSTIDGKEAATIVQGGLNNQAPEATKTFIEHPKTNVPERMIAPGLDDGTKTICQNPDLAILLVQRNVLQYPSTVLNDFVYRASPTQAVTFVKQGGLQYINASLDQDEKEVLHKQLEHGGLDTKEINTKLAAHSI